MALSLMYWSKYVEQFQKLARKSENAANSNRVLKFAFDSELQYVVANVQASMRDRTYKVEIQLSDNFTVEHSSCECPMRLYKCHHVAAALLFGYRYASKTDVKCSWLKHPKSAPPKQTLSVPELYPPSKPSYRALPRPFSVEDRSYFSSQLNALGRFTAQQWLLSPEPSRQTDSDVVLVEELILSQDYTESSCPTTWLRRAVVMNPDRISHIAELTCGQRDNPLWACVRKLRFTASNFGPLLKAVSSKRITPSLKKRLMSAYNLDKVAAIQWGIMHESTALEEYQKMGAQVDKTGIWLHESGVLAASPDGVVRRSPATQVHTSDCHSQIGVQAEPQLVEVKCPYSARDMTVASAAETCKDFFLGCNNGSLSLKETHDYWHQVQGQLHITGCHCCDLVVWTSTDCQIIRINKDHRWAENISRLIEFYFDTFIPSLVS